MDYIITESQLGMILDDVKKEDEIGEKEILDLIHRAIGHIERKKGKGKDSAITIPELQAAIDELLNQ